MVALLGFLAIACFFVGFICLIYPIRAIRISTRGRAAALMGVSFIVFIAAAVMTDTKSIPKKQAESRTSEREVSEQVVVHQSESEPVQPIEALPPKAPNMEVEWNVHKFDVVKDEDISFSNRLRRRIVIVAPTALTREDRLATLIEAAQQAWQKHNSHYIALFLLPFELGPSIARISYAPDKCGISGEDCTDRVWTDAYASDVVFTSEQEQIYTAWEINKDRFKEIDKEYGFEIINEENLKAFLAGQFGTTSGEISKMMLESILAFTDQQEISIPKNLELLGHISEKDQKKAEEKTCRINLSCWGDKHRIAVSVYCVDYIERLAKYDHEWTDGWLELKFSRFVWDDRQMGSLTYIGDQIKFQNGFGAWIPHTYYCSFDPFKQQVLEVQAMPGRL